MCVILLEREAVIEEQTECKNLSGTSMQRIEAFPIIFFLIYILN